MNKNIYYVPIFVVTILLQFLFFIIGVSVYDTNYNVSIALGRIFFLLIPINLVLLILILVNKSKNKKININTNTKVNKLPQRDTLKSYIIEFPFYGVKGAGDLAEETYFDGKKAFKWFDDSIIDAINISWNGSNMIDFISEKKLKKKLQDMQMFICEDGTCKVFISIFEELAKSEKKYLLEFVKGQASDGWGEGNFDFEDNIGKYFRVTFWRNDSDWYIKYIDIDLQKLLLERFKKETEKECYEVELLGENPDIKDNKIGGIPYLPIGEEYPKDNNGNPMLLLLQVNFKDIDLDGFPKDGILEIFVENELMDVYDQEKNSYCVKYYKDNLEYQKDNIPVAHVEKYTSIVDKSYKISLKKTKGYMPYNDFRSEETIKKAANYIMNKELNIVNNNSYEVDKLFGDTINMFYDDTTICIGGYADFTQCDPREHGNSLGDKTVCLFKLDSFYDLEKIFLGDAGILFALISPDELNKKEFDKTYINWDCS